MADERMQDERVPGEWMTGKRVGFSNGGRRAGSVPMKASSHSGEKLPNSVAQ